ncbi:Glycine betaine/carnitine transport binding protein GbuC [Apilactobacillus kunkeei]|uniref:glycine betaine ABC transporter substrate-binding protein n=1 Tax=Apilactobacillus kunkeei TaxID=148814 RepID=UPI001363AF47|nr:glycine betaine ABC transporter substrate-binding protein [Apilactobacillus kunkeei]NBI01184.1 glycine/betaine ABC transporter [Apilactobacillus kunkeei]CAI2640066.1 Glycine betaine/carnitine transport binding protein GbuC [Apilactobacillus kunkeei]CAI2645001.1 Glycine betaine/carnitine transport binding protein GbuC [Apilactobacillus kunkeei]CAI2650469.1 Glycine betaine/carnitine transport binding protein GbuC [Apilactobacillus kunkeei]
MRKKTRYVLATLTMFLMATVLTACSSLTSPYNPHKKLGPQINYTITGIDAGAGIMASTQNALKEYPLAQNKWQLQTSSTAAMTSTLAKAIKYKQPIVVTGWQPHWMFKKFPLKFLKDPKNVYGSSEQIHTIARKGLAKDNPGAYKILKQFHWTPSQMSDVMLQTNAGVDPKVAADNFIKKNPKLYQEWTKGAPRGNGKAVKLTYVAWDSEIASTNVMAEVLNKMDYKATIQALEMQPMWASIATNAADASLSAWLPNTAGLYLKQYKDKIDDVGPNLNGAKVGLAVPKYMKNINSIEDLINK